jgi:hypothetical protein
MTIEQYPSSNNIASTTIWKYTATGSELTLSGYDNYSQALQFSAGSEQVFLNGVLLVRNLDYTPAANGLSITFPSNLAYNDFVQIYCYSNYSIASVASSSITGTIQNSQLTNPSITIGNQSINLGGTLTTPTGLSISGSTNTLTNIPNSALSNSNIIINGVPTPLGGTINITTPNTILSQKGGLIVGTGGGSVAQLTPDVDGTTLVANSASATGVAWATPVASLANPVINGGMDIWARGVTGTANSLVSGGGYNADRWQNYAGSNSITVARYATGDTTNLPNIQYCARVQRNSGQTGGGQIYMVQNLETVNSIPFAGKAITFSFYARAGALYSSASNTLNAEIDTGTGTDQNIFGGFTGVATPLSKTVTLTTNWQRFVLTGTISPIATQMAINLNYSPTNTAGATDYFEVTGVQIDLGTYTATTAPAFRRSGGTLQGELAACQRYAWVADLSAVSLVSGAGFTTSSAAFTIPFPVPMRTAPSATSSGTFTANENGVGTRTFTALGSFGARTTALSFEMSGSSGLTVGKPLAANSGVIVITAEL